jgi:hypothetical protein
MRNVLKNKWMIKLNNSKKSELKENGDLTKDISSEIIISNILKKLDMFDLGFLLIYSTMGGLEIFDASQYICSHNDSRGESTCCCFFHCIENFENESSNDKKYKTTQIIKKKYSVEFISYICEITSYRFKYNSIFSNNKIKNHPWLVSLTEKHSQASEMNLNLEELLKVSNIMSKKISFIKLEKLCDSISQILPLCRSKYHLNKNATDSPGNSVELCLTSSVVEDISFNLGIEKEVLLEKIKPLYQL